MVEHGIFPSLIWNYFGKSINTAPDYDLFGIILVAKKKKLYELRNLTAFVDNWIEYNGLHPGAFRN